MENNNDIKTLLILALAVVIVLGMVVAGMVHANNKNRDFEYKMAAEGYELRPVPGMGGVHWQKTQGDK